MSFRHLHGGMKSPAERTAGNSPPPTRNRMGSSLFGMYLLSYFCVFFFVPVPAGGPAVNIHTDGKAGGNPNENVHV